MHYEYGYMEEGRLGKPHNVRLLKRLAFYALPYKKTVITALALTLLITLFDLAVPYLTKIVIDRYILSSWYPVKVRGLEGSEEQSILKRNAELFKRGRDGSIAAVSQRAMKDMDPEDLQSLKSKGIIGSKSYYRCPPDMDPEKLSGLRSRSFLKTADGALLIPQEELQRLPRERIIEIRGRDLRGVLLIALAFFFALMGIFAASYWEYYFLEFTGQHIMHDIRMDLFGRIQSQALGFFNRHPVGRLVTRVTNDIQNLNEMFKSVIITLFKDFFLILGIMMVLLVVDWHLALLSFLLLPLVFGITMLFSTMAREAFRELRAAVAKINAFLQERIRGMHLIQLFVREANQMRSFSRINHENYLAGMRQIRIFAVFMPLMELLSSLAVAVLVWYGGGQVIQDRLTLGTLVAFISYARMFFRPIRDIAEKYNIMQSAMASAERIFEFMDHREEIPEPSRPCSPRVIEGRISFSNVDFAYEKGYPVLKDISFEVHPGETVAIVGPTGSGKSTVVNLIERFYDPDRGSVRLDGIDLKQWQKSQLRSTISLCMQDLFVFAGTIEENISLGRKAVDHKAVERAAKEANALSFIKELPAQFQQDLGEGGANLSVGQRQLLAFARALAGRPRILILDEATSSVDPGSEVLIQEAIRRMASQRTTLIVAHRPSTVRNADRIIVMNRGRIVEKGSHEELMAAGGLYFGLNKIHEEEKTS